MSYPTFTFDTKAAKPGDRFKHNRSGKTGTFIRMAKNPRNGAIVEWDEHSFADAAGVDLVADRDHLGHRLVPDRERPGEEAHRRHRLVEITARDRERTH